jgi:hypothetical protein
MLHHYIHNILYATPLLEAIQQYLLGSFRALLGRGSNTGDAGDAGNASASNPRTGRGCAFALALALACSTKGANSLSNSESEDSSGIDLSELESLKISLF